MQIKEIQTKEEIFQTFGVLEQIYSNLNQETYVEDVQKMMGLGYKMAGVFEDSDIGVSHCIGVVGIRIKSKINHKKTLEIEDFMIDRKKRGIGVGKMLIRWAEWQAATEKCDNIIGNLETKRIESQRIFAREKFVLDGFLFKRAC